MAASSGTLGKGVTLKHGTSSTTVTQIRDLNQGGESVNPVDITNTDSDDNYREYIPGLIEGGTVDFDCVYTKAEWNELNTVMQARTTETWTITFTDSAVCAFTGFVQDRSIGVPYEDAIMGNITVKVCGKPTWTLT